MVLVCIIHIKSLHLSFKHRFSASYSSGPLRWLNIYLDGLSSNLQVFTLGGNLLIFQKLHQEVLKTKLSQK